MTIDLDNKKLCQILQKCAIWRRDPDGHTTYEISFGASWRTSCAAMTRASNPDFECRKLDFGELQVIETGGVGVGEGA